MNSYKKKIVKKSLIKNVGLHIKHIIITLSSLLLLISCESPTSYSDGYADLNFDLRLPQDENGFYHLEINRNKWQTIHRVNGSITEDGYGIENFMVAWESDLYWYLGDTLGYIVNREFSIYQGKYVTQDTSFTPVLLLPIVTFPIVLLLIISSDCTLAVPSPLLSSKSPLEQAPVTLTEPIPTDVILTLPCALKFATTPYTQESPAVSETFTLA